MKSIALFPVHYASFLTDLKKRIRNARLSAGRVVNREMILLYWDIGRSIVEKQKRLGWGESVIDRLSQDLLGAFPGITGFSPRNLRDMKRFFVSYSSHEFWRRLVAKMRTGKPSTFSAPIWRQAVAKLQTGDTGNFIPFLRQAVADIPWGQHLTILNKVSEPAARLYYLRATAQFGWSRHVLLNQIKAGAYQRSLAEGKTHNFPAALPEYLAEQAEEALKSSYNLEFLGISHEMKEREMESRLVEQVQRFILELGYGFCFIGRQYRLVLGLKEYFIDLLFYHDYSVPYVIPACRWQESMTPLFFNGSPPTDCGDDSFST